MNNRAKNLFPFQVEYYSRGTPVYERFSQNWTCPEIGVLALLVDSRHREIANALMEKKPDIFRSLYDVIRAGSDYERRLTPMFSEELQASRGYPVAANGLEWAYIVGPAGIIMDFENLGLIVQKPTEKRSLSVNLFGRLVAEACDASMKSEERSRELHEAAEQYRRRIAQMARG